jgi:hypothetical protein
VGGWGAASAPTVIPTWSIDENLILDFLPPLDRGRVTFNFSLWINFSLFIDRPVGPYRFRHRSDLCDIRTIYEIVRDSSPPLPHSTLQCSELPVRIAAIPARL